MGPSEDQWDIWADAIFAGIFAFITCPFSALGYLTIVTLVAVEVFLHVTSSNPQQYANRMFIILSTLVGRAVGELFWPFVLYQGRCCCDNSIKKN